MDVKNVVKIFLSIVFFITSFTIALATESYDAVVLQPTSFVNLEVPKTPASVFATVNQDYEIVSGKELEDEGTFYAEDDITDSKVAKTFFKFIDDRVINNKINKFSSNLGNELNARAP